MAKKKPQIVGFEEISNEEPSSNLINEIPSSSDEKGDEDNMTTGKEQTTHNLIEMDEEVTVKAEGIADLFDTVKDDGGDKEIVDMLSEAEGDKPKAPEAPKDEPVKVTIEDARAYMLTLLDHAFPNFVQEFHDRRVKGEEMSTKDVKGIIVERAIEAALADPKQADIIKNFGGKKEWRKFLKAQLETDSNKKRFKAMVKELKQYSDEELEAFLELQKKSTPVEPKKPEATTPVEDDKPSATDANGNKVEVEIVEDEPFLLSDLDKKNKKSQPEKPKAEEPKKTVVPPVTSDEEVTGAAQMIVLPDIVHQRFTTGLYGYKAV